MTNVFVNETLLFSSKKESVTNLSWEEIVAIALLKRQSFLNVSRESTALYIFILLVKNAFVCHGIQLSAPSPTVFLLTFRTIIHLWPIQNNLDLTFIVLDWAMVLYFGLGYSEAVRNHGSSPLLGAIYFLSSLTVMTGLSIFSPTHSCSELIVDSFCIAKLTWYILYCIWGYYDAYTRRCASETISSLLLLTIDVTIGTRGLLFDLFCIFNTCFHFIAGAYNHRKLMHYLVFIVICVYCIRVRIKTHGSHFQVQDWQREVLRRENMIITGDPSEEIALHFFRF